MKLLSYKKKHFKKCLVICIAILFVATTNAQINYVRTFDATAPEQNATTLMGRWVSDVKTTTQYIDGLGRPMQTVVKQGSLETATGVLADAVSTNLYDEYGRETIKYLPFVANNAGGNTSIADGGFKTNALVQQNIFATAQYPNENNFYSKTNLEASPLNRPIESYAPGISWAGSEANTNLALRRNVQIKYYTNTALDNVKIWTVRSSLTNPSFQTTVVVNNNGTQTVTYNWGTINNASAVSKLYRLLGTTVWSGGTAGPTSPSQIIIPVGNYEYAIQVYYNNGTASNIVQTTSVDYNTSYATITSYPAGELFKTITIDEHKKQVIEFKDKEGKVILKKVQLTAADDNGIGVGYTGWLCTFYMYDEFNNLSCVLQPNAVKQMNDNNNWAFTADPTILTEQAFRYEYDSRNRMVKKKVPGAGEVWMVYDLNDRLVLMQDGNMRSQQKWMYTTYDELSRPISTGLITDAANYNNLNYHLNAANASTTAYPNVAAYTSEELSTNFYDNYDWLAIPTYANPLTGVYNNTYDTYFQPASNTAWPYPQTNVQSAQLKGMPTGGRTKVISPLGGGTTYLYSIALYDEKGRAIQSQSTNITGGVDIATTQYTWAGQPLVIISKQQKAGGILQETVTLTQLTYDDLGRVIKTEKKLSNTLVNAGAMAAYKTIAENKYDKLGQLVYKNLGTKPTAAAPLAKLAYEYNIRGWLTSVNKNFVTAGNTGANNDEYFGMQLGYDKDAFGSFTKKQYNGNIAGSIWRSAGDGMDRKYDYDYDAANRLLKADFTQHDGTSFVLNPLINFNVKMGDGVDPNLAYDYNGNILKMQQWGLKINNSPQIDNLIYNYITGSNKLARVTDVGALTSDNGKLGDFKDGTNIGDDYLYDANGNLNLDNNKAISNITYNHLNLPSVINIIGKGSIAYTYDAAGNKLRKVTLENGTPNKTITTTTNYINGLVYESKTTVSIPANPNDPPNYNDVLQFLPQEEGRIRFKPAILNTAGAITTPASFAYDYMLKDHLGNVRVVITEEQKVDPYPAATMEVAQTATEESIYTGLNTTRIDKPVGYPVDNTTTPNDKVAKVNGSGNKIGPSITLKVMAGDKFNVKVSSWYKTNNVNPAPPTTPILGDLINGFLGGVGGAISSSHGTTTTTQIQNSGVLTPNINNFLSTQVNDPSRPKAYLNWILFDEQFNFVSSSSGAEQVPAESFYGTAPSNQVKQHIQTDLPINKSGYLYVYVSNETPNIDVFFDNLQVTHTRGAMLEESHYYPFGLTMAGISSKSAGGMQSRYKFNGGTEFNNDFDISFYETEARSYDPQIGRFLQIDPLADAIDNQSPFVFADNNPILLNDPLGLEAEEAEDGGKKKRKHKPAPAPAPAPMPHKPTVVVVPGKTDARITPSTPTINPNPAPAPSPTTTPSPTPSPTPIPWWVPALKPVGLTLGALLIPISTGQEGTPMGQQKLFWELTRYDPWPGWGNNKDNTNNHIVYSFTFVPTDKRTPVVKYGISDEFRNGINRPERQFFALQLKYGITLKMQILMRTINREQALYYESQLVGTHVDYWKEMPREQKRPLAPLSP
jgi:RHS repeat-associated protein